MLDYTINEPINVVVRRVAGFDRKGVLINKG